MKHRDEATHRAGDRTRPASSARHLPAVISIVALVVAGLALGVVLTRPPAADLSSCQTAAWDSVPKADALPAGWSLGTTVFSIDSLGVTLVGPTPSSGTSGAIAYISVSCYGGSGHDALTRSHQAALTGGGTDLAFGQVGDESAAIREASGTVSVYLLRGRLVASVAAASTVDVGALEQAARAIDDAMAHAQSLTAGASGTTGSTPSAAAVSGAPSPSPSEGQGPSAGPSPTPNVGAAPTGSAPDSHAAPDLEALLPRSVNGTALASQSLAGADALGSDVASQALGKALTDLGRTPADFAIAEAYDPTGNLGVYVLAFRVTGIDGAHLEPAIVDSWLAAAPSGVTRSTVPLGDKSFTKVTFGDGGAADYVYPHGNVVFDIQTADDSLARAAAALLP